MLRLRGLITHNPGLKLLALIMAVILWFMAVGRERAEVGLNVPVEMVNFPKNMVVANQVPDGISVRIRGSVALTRQVQDRKPAFQPGPGRRPGRPQSFHSGPRQPGPAAGAGSDPADAQHHYRGTGKAGQQDAQPAAGHQG